MAEFKNLGDLISRDRDMAKLAVVDLGGEETPREYCYAELDAMTMGVARGLPSAALPAVTASPSCRPTASSTSPPISASCARAWSRCR